MNKVLPFILTEKKFLQHCFSTPSHKHIPYHEIPISVIGSTRCTVYSLLRLIDSTCFDHFFVHYQEVLYIQQLVYFYAFYSNPTKIYQSLYIKCPLMMSKK
jgi:hypothetical protein